MMTTQSLKNKCLKVRINSDGNVDPSELFSQHATSQSPLHMACSEDSVQVRFAVCFIVFSSLHAEPLTYSLPRCYSTGGSTQACVAHLSGHHCTSPHCVTHWAVCRWGNLNKSVSSSPGEHPSSNVPCSAINIVFLGYLFFRISCGSL